MSQPVAFVPPSAPGPISSDGLRPSRVRHQVLAWICSLSLLTYLDRVCIAGSAPYITEDLSLTPVQMGWAFSAFAMAYALFEIPGGWMGDRIGPRLIITRIVVWWSVFTIWTGLVNRLWTLITVRFLFGAGEAGAYPNAAKVFSRWMPDVERGFATGLMWMCGRWGGAFAPGLVVLMIGFVGWRATFWVFGAIGIVWAVFFFRWFRNNPEENTSVNRAELELIRRGQDPAPAGHLRVPWSRLVRSGNLWAICWMYFCMAYGWYFYITWLPTYLRSRGISMAFGGLPLLFGGVGCFLGGMLTDFVVRRTGNLKRRRVIGFGGFFLGSLAMLASTQIADPLAAVLTISLASFFGDLTMGSCWAVCLDVGHELAGTVSGAMNMWGNFAGFLFPVVTGFLVQQFGRWDLPIMVSSAVFFAGALLWLRIDPTESVLKEKEARAA
jgi:MFS family permease